MNSATKQPTKPPKKPAAFKTKDSPLVSSVIEPSFEQIFQTSPIGMALVSPKGLFINVNPALCEIVGYSQKELIKKTFQDITHPEDLEKDLDYVQRVLSGKIKNYTIEKRYIHKKGAIIWIQLDVSLVRDKSDKPLYFISQIQDITATKKLFLQLFASEKTTKTGSYSFNIKTKETSWSRGMYDIFEIAQDSPPPSFEEVLTIYFKEDKNLIVDSLQKILKTGQSQDTELKVYIPKKQKYKYLQMSAIPDPSFDKDTNPVIFGAAQDITVLKEKIIELEKLNNLMIGREVKMAALKKALHEAHTPDSIERDTTNKPEVTIEQL